MSNDVMAKGEKVVQDAAKQGDEILEKGREKKQKGLVYAKMMKKEAAAFLNEKVDIAENLAREQAKYQYPALPRNPPVPLVSASIHFGTAPWFLSSPFLITAAPPGKSRMSLRGRLIGLQALNMVGQQ